MAKDRLAFISCLICSSNSRLCALPLEQVSETMRALPIDPFPEMPAFLLGVSIIRGAVVPVVNVARLAGGAAGTQPARYVTLKSGERRIAFAVDSVIGVRELPIDALGEMPPLLREVDAGIVAAITTLDATLLLILEGARSISESVWQKLDAQVPQV